MDKKCGMWHTHTHGCCNIGELVMLSEISSCKEKCIIPPTWSCHVHRDTKLRDQEWEIRTCSWGILGFRRKASSSVIEWWWLHSCVLSAHEFIVNGCEGQDDVLQFLSIVQLVCIRFWVPSPEPCEKYTFILSVGRLKLRESSERRMKNSGEVDMDKFKKVLVNRPQNWMWNYRTSKRREQKSEGRKLSSQ